MTRIAARCELAFILEKPIFMFAISSDSLVIARPSRLPNELPKMQQTIHIGNDPHMYFYMTDNFFDYDLNVKCCSRAIAIGGDPHEVINKEKFATLFFNAATIIDNDN